MIDHIRLYYLPKHEYQDWFLKTKLLNEKNSNYNLKTGNQEYPITCSENGINITIDEYNSFITIHLKSFNNSLEGSKKLSSLQNISFSKLENVLQKVEPYLLNTHKTKISQIQLHLTIPTEISGKSIIEKNILMFKYQYYNHNTNKSNKKNIKDFEFRNFSFTFNAEKKGDKLNYLNLILKMNKSIEFKELLLTQIHQLLDREKLHKLFSIFLKRYDQFIIVDDIDSYEIFDGNDKNLMLKFMTHNYWKNTTGTISKQAFYNQKKKFESLLSKYKLLKLKDTFRSKLELAFEKFINN